MDTPATAQAVKRLKFAAPSELTTKKARDAEKHRRWEAIKLEVNMKAASWEAANPGKSQALKKARRKMIKDAVSDKL